MNSISRLIVRVHICSLMAICRNVKEYLFTFGAWLQVIGNKIKTKSPCLIASSYIYTHVQLPILRLDGERYTVVVSNRGRIARCRAAVL